MGHGRVELQRGCQAHVCAPDVGDQLDVAGAGQGHDLHGLREPPDRTEVGLEDIDRSPEN